MKKDEQSFYKNRFSKIYWIVEAWKKDRNGEDIFGKDEISEVKNIRSMKEIEGFA